MSSDAPKDFGGCLSSARSRLPVPLGAISSSKNYSCSCSALHRERKPLKLLQLQCTACWNSWHQKGEEKECLYLFKLIIEAPAEMWRQTDRRDRICGVLLSKATADQCIDFLPPAQNEAALPEILLAGNVGWWDRTGRVSSSIATEHHSGFTFSAASVGRSKPLNMSNSLQKFFLLHQEKVKALLSSQAASEAPRPTWALSGCAAAQKSSL